MDKKLGNEDQIWAIAYGLALVALIIGESTKNVGLSDKRFAEAMDSRAAAVADKAAKQLKERFDE